MMYSKLDDEHHINHYDNWDANNHGPSEWFLQLNGYPICEENHVQGHYTYHELIKYLQSVQKKGSKGSKVGCKNNHPYIKQQDTDQLQGTGFSVESYVS